jgi:two-component sensor histidine kinase
VERELGPYLQEGQERVRIAGPLILVDPDAAQAISVILHELATNAAKYGAPSVTEGHAQVTWSYGPDGRIVPRWEERGSPTTTAPSHVGFGTRMIWRMVSDQLSGEMRLDWRAEGLACEIVFPI